MRLSEIVRATLAAIALTFCLAPTAMAGTETTLYAFNGEDGAVPYDQRDAEGFIRLNALRLRTLARRRRKLEGRL